MNFCNDDSRLYQLAKYPIGVAINMDGFYSNVTYLNIANSQFNSFTAENIFKPESLHPYENTYDWTAADHLAAFCLQNNKRLHGHTLIWHKQLPLWIINYEGNATAWEELLKQHIQTIVLHFKGQVGSWDVVNEAFNEDGTLRNNIWKQKIGSGYIEKAFIYAHNADPEAQLFYNDYNLEFNTRKRNSVINYFNNLRNRGVKIDGIGLQMHVGISYPEPSQIATAFQQVVTNHYKIHLSELDVSVNQLGKTVEFNQSLFTKQADYLGKIISSYQQLPSKYQFGMTFWGVSDKDSWIPNFYEREDYPLLFDYNYEPKPAYCKLLEVL